MNYYLISYTYITDKSRFEERIDTSACIEASDLQLMYLAFADHLHAHALIRYNAKIDYIFVEKIADKEGETQMERRNDADSSKEAG